MVAHLRLGSGHPHRTCLAVGLLAHEDKPSVAPQPCRDTALRPAVNACSTSVPTCLELGPGFAVVVASDKLFYWLFQNQPDRILPLLPDLPSDARGYRFSAPVLKEREYRLDGLFLPPPERRELPALILEAQMAPDPGFLRRLYAETARLLQQEPSIERWRVVVLCPSRQLNFGDPAPVAEFVEQRVQWIELLSAAANPTAPALVQALALLLQSEQDLPATSSALRARVAGPEVPPRSTT